MADFSNIPNFHLKITLITHLMMISLASMGYWSSSAYLFYNSILVITLLWGIHKNDSDEPLQMAIFINATSILLDIVLLVLRFPDDHSAAERFSAAMAILHLIIRPFSILFLSKILQSRGSGAGNIGNLFAGPRTHSYEDMDKNVAPPPHQSGYDFTTAQQI